MVQYIWCYYCEQMAETIGRLLVLMFLHINILTFASCHGQHVATYSSVSPSYARLMERINVFMVAGLNSIKCLIKDFDS